MANRHIWVYIYSQGVIYPYMPICHCLWALGICKKIGIRTYFGSVTVRSGRGFRHFACWRHGLKLATFFIVIWTASFKLIQKLATLNPEKLQDCREILLQCVLQCYKIVVKQSIFAFSGFKNAFLNPEKLQDCRETPLFFCYTPTPVCCSVCCSASWGVCCCVL